MEAQSKRCTKCSSESSIPSHEHPEHVHFDSSSQPPVVPAISDRPPQPPIYYQDNKKSSPLLSERTIDQVMLPKEHSEVASPSFDLDGESLSDSEWNQLLGHEIFPFETFSIQDCQSAKGTLPELIFICEIHHIQDELMDDYLEEMECESDVSSNSSTWETN